MLPPGLDGLQEPAVVARSGISVVQTSDDVRQEKLAAKYSQKWLRKVYPNGTKRGQRQHSQAGDPDGGTASLLGGASGGVGQALLPTTRGGEGDEEEEEEEEEQECPVWRIFIHGDQGRTELIKAGDFVRLQPGAPVIQSHASSFVGPFHPAFPTNCWYLPSRKQYWSTNQDDFMTILFSKPTLVLILLPSQTNEPRWLHALFTKIRGPDLATVELSVDWKISLADRLLFFAVGSYDKMRLQTLRAFKSRKVYLPGEELVLGGDGLADLTDSQFVVAFHHQRQEEAGEPSPEPAQQQQGQGGLGRLVADSGTLAASGVSGQWPILSPLVPAQSKRGGSISDGGFTFSVNGGPTSETGAAAGGSKINYDHLGYDEWFSRLVKNVRRNRLVDVQAMLDQDLAKGPNASHVLKHNICHLPPSEKEQLLTDIPANGRCLDMMCVLVDRSKCQMSFKALTFLIHYFEDVPSKYGGAEGLLLKYLEDHGSQLSVVAAIIRVCRLEIASRPKKKPTAQLVEMKERFERLQGLLLLRAQSFVKGTETDPGQKLLRLQAMLDFKLVVLALGDGQAPKRPEPATIGDFRPLRVAFADRDGDFMISPIVEAFTRLRWQGSEYLQETCKDGSSSLSVLNPHLLAVVLSNLGFAPPEQPTLEWAAVCWHNTTFSSQAFFNSPRARWVLRLLANTAFVFIFYLSLVGSSVVPSWFQVQSDRNAAAANGADPTLGDADLMHLAIVNCLWGMWLLGNVVESIQILALRSKDEALRLLAAQKQIALYLALDTFMLALAIIDIADLYNVAVIDSTTLVKLNMAGSAMAPLICMRVLFVMIPLLQKLGPMLSTFKAMVAEVVLFAIPWVVITTGFSVTLQSVFMPQPIDQFNSFWNSMFFLFVGFADKVDYTALDGLSDSGMDSDTIALYRIYGTIVFIIYAILSTILLGNLLIAIVTNRYRPEQEHSQSVLNFAEVVDEHMFQVEMHLLCSPFNLITLLFEWMPSHWRRKVHPNAFRRLGLPFLDGFLPATPTHQLLPMGKDEIPHLIYLLVFVPPMTCLSMALYFLHLPFCALYFSIWGHARLSKQVKAMVLSAAQHKQGSGSQFKPGLSLPSSSGAISMGAGGGGSRSQGIVNPGRNSINTSGSDIGADPAGAPPPPPKTLLDALMQGPLLLWSALRWGIYLCLGAVIYTVLGLLVVVLWPVWVWLCALAWSLHNILWGAASLGLIKLKAVRARRQQQVLPEQSTVSQAGKLAQETLDRQQKERARASNCISREDLLDCIAQCFERAAAEAPHERGGPPPAPPASRGFSRAAHAVAGAVRLRALFDQRHRDGSSEGGAGLRGGASGGGGGDAVPAASAATAPRPSGPSSRGSGTGFAAVVAASAGGHRVQGASVNGGVEEGEPGSAGKPPRSKWVVTDSQAAGRRPDGEGGAEAGRGGEGAGRWVGTDRDRDADPAAAAAATVVRGVDSVNGVDDGRVGTPAFLEPQVSSGPAAEEERDGLVHRISANLAAQRGSANATAAAGTTAAAGARAHQSALVAAGEAEGGAAAGAEAGVAAGRWDSAMGALVQQLQEEVDRELQREFGIAMEAALERALAEAADRVRARFLLAAAGRPGSALAQSTQQHQHQHQQL